MDFSHYDVSRHLIVLNDAKDKVLPASRNAEDKRHGRELISSVDPNEVVNINEWAANPQPVPRASSSQLPQQLRGPPDVRIDDVDDSWNSEEGKATLKAMNGELGLPIDGQERHGQ